MGKNNLDHKKNIYILLADVILLVAIAVPFVYLYYSRLIGVMAVRFLTIGNYFVIGVYVALAILFINTFKGFKIGTQRISILCLSQAIAMALANFMMMVIEVLMIRFIAYIWHIVGYFVILTLVQCFIVLVVTYVATKVFRLLFPPYRVLNIHGEYENNLVEKMNRRDDKYEVSESISCQEDMLVIRERIKEFDAVLLNDVPSEKRNDILKICFDEQVRVYFTPKISDIIICSSDEVNLFDTPLYLCRNVGMSPIQSFIKRLGDIVISLIGIIITSPIMAVTAIAIHKYDGGPALYKQTRCTKGGREYQIMKFRSMITNAEADGKARLAQENDDRITPIGHFIRATRIDELPQFFNILKGDMSIVGPRPERPEIIKEYVETVPEFAYRTRVKAGLTGYAQVYGKYNTTSYDKLKLDMIYVEKCSVLLDIQLILMTLRVILTKDATEGVDEGQTNANVK